MMEVTTDGRNMVLAYDYPLLGIFWTLVLIGFAIAIGFVVIYVLIDNLRRPHRGVVKAAWTLGIIAFPLVGALVYIVTRPEMGQQPPIRPAY